MKYSIITPVYNRADCVARCIESVINQKNSNNCWECEHIIVNDGSNDDTDAIVKGYVTKCSHLVYVNFKKNQGTNAARNAAINHATGDYCIILDSDDFFVPNALDIISKTMKDKPGFKHYMFTPDDRKEYFDNHESLKEENIITFEDFLSQKYTGDFIHVIKKDVMQMYPFDESLRIYEGIFFLKFYREAQNICFVNAIVTIRERGRDDSVTKEYVKTNKQIVKNSIKALETQIEWYKNDYVKFGLKSQICNLYVQLINNYLLLGDYKSCHEIFNCAQNERILIPSRYKYLCAFRLGFIYKTMLYTYFKIKYNLLNFKVK